MGLRIWACKESKGDFTCTKIISAGIVAAVCAWGDPDPAARRTVCSPVKPRDVGWDRADVDSNDLLAPATGPRSAWGPSPRVACRVVSCRCPTCHHVGSRSRLGYVPPLVASTVWSHRLIPTDYKHTSVCAQKARERKMRVWMTADERRVATRVNLQRTRRGDKRSPSMVFCPEEHVSSLCVKPSRLVRASPAHNPSSSWRGGGLGVPVPPSPSTSLF